ncbi:TIGR03086 family metal-binding protein [Nucisporomicrobium flavum]|uniref:TIGR03086 family metal-binding protein n=1 Tax=Nucisporomicrobium flavum TaxID=2785915 RepID=UPI0018F36285|nr:TIGR03086 family metal-binding protein [Nucisporomicrobium flavum]
MHMIELDERAVRASVTVVAGVSPDDLPRPTPCAEWDLATLLAHMTVQHRGFAAAAAGRGADPALWVPAPLAADFAAGYAAAAEEVISAFAAPGVPDRGFDVPEFGAQAVPGHMAIGFHFVDYLVHGWDVAAAIGSPYEPDADLVEAALPIVEAVPDDERRLQPGAPFAPALPDPGTGPFDRLLALLGRSRRQSVTPGR